MVRKKWELGFGFFLVFLSGVLYYVHFLIFKDPHHIFIYMLGDLAFLPLEVLFVVLIIEKIIGEREKRIRLEKLNVVINTFFSETGYELLGKLLFFDENSDKLKKNFSLDKRWKKSDFIKAIKRFKMYTPLINSRRGNLEELRNFLNEKRNFILSLLENPALLENYHFTDLLWATLHLQEELDFRKQLDVLPETDYQHLSNDIKRVYLLLFEEYFVYAMNLKMKYPYLFSLTYRISPLNPGRKVEVIE